jgi:hypothetical protein
MLVALNWNEILILMLRWVHWCEKFVLTLEELHSGEILVLTLGLTLGRHFDVNIGAYIRV